MNEFIQEKIASWSLPEREIFEERAAIMEFCGNMPREQAEIEAFRLLAPRSDLKGLADKVDQLAMEFA